MARPKKARSESQIIDTEKRWKNICDNCKKPLNGEKNKPTTHPAQIYTIPRLIFLPESRIPLIIPELNMHLLICNKCAENYGEPVAVEDRGFYREQKILWDKPDTGGEVTGFTKFCGLCTKGVGYANEAELEERVGAIYVLPRIILKDGELRQAETRKSEIRLIICKECAVVHYRPLGVEQTWRFEGDILRPELLSIKKRN
jgi:hypothetical protein